jgi:hypothetical protein
VPGVLRSDTFGNIEFKKKKNAHSAPTGRSKFDIVTLLKILNADAKNIECTAAGR